MDNATREQYEQRLAELASFCFRKLANLEARFIALCARAQAAGIDCADLQSPDPPGDEMRAPLSMVN